MYDLSFPCLTDMNLNKVHPQDKCRKFKSKYAAEQELHTSNHDCSNDLNHEQKRNIPNFKRFLLPFATLLAYSR
jgi:hypothetical protein